MKKYYKTLMVLGIVSFHLFELYWFMIEPIGEHQIRLAESATYIVTFIIIPLDILFFGMGIVKFIKFVRFLIKDTQKRINKGYYC